eukprot:Phypoly_transcript_04763.p1 GENE.Phypoly_transcript_04763~~Phypoly_transcript_04763.p1  ORF type:complete len:530 (+),score=84.18 Phypoly_transcript_04763:103-1692(+)
MAYPLVIGGLALGGLTMGIKYLSKEKALAAEVQRVHEEEEKGAKRAESLLLASSYYADLDNLRKEIEGEIILPSDGHKYQEARRRAFNQNQRGYPCVLARVQHTRDVVHCVKFVNKHRKDINLCVASGCHSSKSIMDGSFVIDLYRMNKTVLDEANMTIKVEGGAYLEEIDKVCKPHNFGIPVGTYPQTGVGGLVLGGGYGFLSRMLGFSVDNFMEAELVTCTGEVLIANDSQNSDLMWGLRGGSGNFGIVTSFTFRVHKLPTYCLSGIVASLTPTHSSALSLVTNYDKLISEMPNNSSAMIAFPAGAPVTPTIWAYFGEEKNPSEVPLLQKGKNLGGWINVQNSVKVSSYHKDLQTITTPLVMSGHIYHTLIQFGELGKEMPQEFWDKLLTHTRAKPHQALAKAVLVLFTMGGVMATNDPDGSKTCLTYQIRRARYFAILEVYWKPEFGEEGKNVARDWARAVAAIIKPYNNEALRYAAADSSTATADTLERDQAGYGNDTIPKLRALKKKYDPTNFFKNNVNIAPSE